jgi:hypothetical protein
MELVDGIDRGPGSAAFGTTAGNGDTATGKLGATPIGCAAVACRLGAR